MSLRDDLAARRDRARAAASPERLAAIDGGIAAVEAGGHAARALTVGDVAPDFTLPDVDGRAVSSADLRAAGPVIVAFYRGGWCAYCVLELRAWAGMVDAVRAAGVGLVAVGPQTVEASAATADDVAAPFPVLSDVGNAVARSFGIVHPLTAEVAGLYAASGYDLPTRNAQDPDALELPLPATFVLDRDGIVRLAFVSADYTLRAEPEEVLAVAAAC